MAFSFGVSASEPVKKVLPPSPPLDTHQACYYENIAYSKGSVISVGPVQLECVRTIGSNGVRGEENPLQWIKAT
ncbi:DUF1496 domain-containing protein [Pseudomonas fluorescens]|uniref:DUF1496 domain-containing protein n=1 Tax=Pseudomonas fluorescens TaxID=294 RepID=UPI003965A4FC